MFGGFAYYLQDKLILVLFEKEGDRSYLGETYEFDLWNGCMFPVEKQFHSEVLRKYPFLVNHPVLPKWLYLPQQVEDFEERAEKIVKRLFAPQSLWGVVPQRKRKKTTAKPKKEKIEIIDSRRPRMFSDEAVEVDFSKVKNISDLKNLGPASEKEFLKAGIKTAQQFKKIGWKKAMEKLVKVNPKNAHSVFAYALVGALNNKEWFRLSSEEKTEIQTFVRKLRNKK